jgi:hypothetical protein
MDISLANLNCDAFTLRDRFALAAAEKALEAREQSVSKMALSLEKAPYERLSRDAYQFADAMMQARAAAPVAP